MCRTACINHQSYIAFCEYLSFELLQWVVSEKFNFFIVCKTIAQSRSGDFDLLQMNVNNNFRNENNVFFSQTPVY